MPQPCPSPKPKQVCLETLNMLNIKIVALFFFFPLKNILGKAVFHILNKNLARPYYWKLCTEGSLGWQGANAVLRSITPTEALRVEFRSPWQLGARLL